MHCKAGDSPGKKGDGSVDVLLVNKFTEEA